MTTASPASRALWAETRLLRWPGLYRLVSLPCERLAEGAEWVTLVPQGAFAALVLERDEVSLTLPEALAALRDALGHWTVNGPARAVVRRRGRDRHGAVRGRLRRQRTASGDERQQHEQAGRGRLRLPDGALSCVYLMAYSSGRVWIEALRLDPLCLVGVPPFCTGGLRMAQLMSLVLIALGGLGLWWLLGRRRALPDPSGVRP